MANEAIGTVDCPLCGGVATVHQNRRAERLRYMRCGVVVRGFSTGCGTLQPYGDSGQRWIADRLQPITEHPKGSHPAETAPETAPAPAPADPEPPITVQPDPTPQPDPKPARRGFWQSVIEGATGEI